MKFSTVWDMEYNMKSNGLYCGLNMPEALISKKEGEEEFKHRLPPYAKRKFFLVDEYPACPDTWMRSEGKLTSYFVPVQEGKGLWLDFNANWNNKHHVAIVISVQGINPITGLPCNDAHLEQYIEECPKCKKKFGPNRFCKTCGHIWPKQNYISTTGSSFNQLWLDGFRTAEGVVRQYILTQEKIKGVASNIIGEDRVYAIGMSFFLSKEAKLETQSVLETISFFSPVCTPINWQVGTSGNPTPPPTYNDNTYNGGWQNRVSDYFDETPINSSISSSDCSSISSSSWFEESSSEDDVLPSSLLRSISKNKGGKTKSLGKIENKVTKAELQKINSQLAQTANDPNLTIATHHAFNVAVEKVEVGAGANINQIVGDDPESLDFWKSEPESIIVVNYCKEEDCEKIIRGGKVSLKGHKEGFLKEVVVGN